MRNVLTGVVILAGLTLLCASTDAEAAKKKKKAAVAAVAAVAAGAAGAAGASSESPAAEWSLQDKQYWVALQAELDHRIMRLNEMCGTKITGSFDKESFRGRLTEGGTYGLSGYARSHCAAGPEAIEDICRVSNDDEASAKVARAAVTSKLTNIECKWGGKGKEAITFAAKKLTTTIDSESSSASTFGDKVKSTMKQRL